MADKVKIWFDREGDYLEVQFKEAPGYMQELHTILLWNVSMPRAISSALVFWELAV